MQRPLLKNKSTRETSAQGSGGSEPMELGMARRRTLTRKEIQKLRTENACFLLSQAKRRACCAGLPIENEARGKRDRSLVLTVGANEAEIEDGGAKLCSSARFLCMLDNC